MTIQQHHLYELQCNAGLIKGEKTPESNKASEARMAALEAKTDNHCDQSLFADEKPNASDKNNPALDRKGSDTRQNSADSLMVMATKRGQSAQCAEEFY